MSYKKEDNESWNEQKASLKQKLLSLNNNLFLEPRVREDWLTEIQIKFGKTREELLQLIKNI